jgi:hypothetical protein
VSQQKSEYYLANHSELPNSKGQVVSLFLDKLSKSIGTNNVVEDKAVEDMGQGTWWIKTLKLSSNCDFSCIKQKLQYIDCKECGTMIWTQNWTQDNQESYRYSCRILIAVTEPVVIMYNAMNETISFFYLKPNK